MELNFKEIGEQATNYTEQILINFANFVGINPNQLPTKLLSMIFLLLGLWGSLKIGQTVVKIILIVILGLVIFSIGLSILS